MALQDRMMRAVKGEVALYEEVEHDQSATTQALIIVAVAALSGGIGSALASGVRSPSGGLVGLVSGVAISLVGWAVFSFVAFFIGTKLFSAEATWEEVLRPLGFAYTPMLLGIVTALGAIGGIVIFVAGLWTLYLAFVAIRAALDIDTGKTIATILLSIIPTIIIALLISLPLAVLRAF